MSSTPTHSGPARPVFIASREAPPSPPPAPPLPPPPAPPLPSGKYVQRAATAFGRLAHPFFLGSRPSSAQGHRDGRGRPEGMRPAVHRTSSPLSSRSATHKTGIPIAALDISPERTHAILAGRDILKTVKVSHASCTEDFNLRSKITAYASAHHASRDAASAQHRDQLAAKDVKWSRGNFSTTIATAAANGKVVVYDINRPSIEIGRLHEHARQVHKLAFNPHQGALLISGSQDGTVRMWDMRDLRTDRAARSIRKFVGYSEGVRDLKWSPTDGVEFAAGTDAGTIQRWDFRKDNAPILKLNAHDKFCMSLDWHPSGRYLASGSADKTIKVWDFRSTDRRMKPHWQLRAPQAVMTIRWRPGNASSGDGASDGKPTTYLASSYDARDPRIHIWDFRRPHVPFQEIDKYDTSASDFLWHSEDRLWSVGITGIFAQTDLNFVPKPLDRTSINVLATGPESGLCFFSEARPTRRVSLTDAEDYFLRGPRHQDSSGERLSGSPSANEGSFEESGHPTNTLKKRRPKFASSRLTPQPSSAAGGIGEEGKLFDLPTLDPIYRSPQTAAIGRIPGIFDPDSFRYLAETYRLPKWDPHASDESILDSMRECFEENAAAAFQTGQYRLAQTWRILGHAAQTELAARVESLRRNQASVKLSDSAPAPAPAVAEMLRSPKLTHTVEVSRALHGLASHSDAGSSVPTPLARPVREMPSIPASDEQPLEQDPKTGALPFASPLWRQRRASIQLATRPPVPREPSSIHQTAQLGPDHKSRDLGGDLTEPPLAEFPDLEQQMEERRNAMNNYRARPRTLLRLDNPIEDSINIGSGMPPLDRHDSNESFQMFSGSTDSDPRSVALAGSFGEMQSRDASAVNSLASSVNQDFVPNTQLRQSQLRQSHPAGTREEESGDSGASVTAESPLFENMSFPMEHEPDAKGEQMIIDDPQPIRRPSTIIAPLIHRGCDTDEAKAMAPPVSQSLLLANPAPPVLDPPPWTLSALLPPLLEYHLETLCDTQLPSILVLSLYPFCPALFSDSPPPPTYLLAYHELLICLRLFIEAAALRNAALFIFPDIGIETTVDQGRGTGADEVGLWCGVCRKPVKGNVRGWCKRCCTEWAECAICEQIAPPPSEYPSFFASNSLARSESSTTSPSTALWSWCQGCGHGGHTSCLRSWWRTASGASGPDASDGACSVAGCGHACVIGSRRDLRLAAIAAAGKSERSSSVARDSWIAGESRAVEVATRTLSGRGSSSAGTKATSTPISSFGGPLGRPTVEEAVVVVDAERRGSADPSKDGLPRSLSGGGRSLSGGGRSFSGGGRRVRLALPGTTPPAAVSAVADLREGNERHTGALE